MKNKTTYTVDTIFVLVLFAVFAITVLFVLMTGAGVYKNTQALMQERYEERTGISYITAKVHSFDEKDKIQIEDFNDVKSLTFTSEVDGIESITRMYFYGGYIRELTSPKDIELPLSAGQKIVAAGGLDFSADGDLLTITCKGTKGSVSKTTLYVASGMEAGK